MKGENNKCEKMKNKEDLKSKYSFFFSHQYIYFKRVIASNKSGLLSHLPIFHQANINHIPTLPRKYLRSLESLVS